MVQLAIDIRGHRGDFDYHWQLSVDAEGVVGIFGANGAGKTTLLRALAGLDHAVGRITVDGDSWLDSKAGICKPPHRRAVGYVFQDARLLPHLSVMGNLRFASDRAGGDRAHMTQTLQALDLEPLLSRPVSALSGGERQRVAIAQALLSKPRLLLMDEPLSANDMARRSALLPYLRRILRETSQTTLFVSHSIDEIAALTDTLVICDRGSVNSVGATDALMQQAGLAALRSEPEAGSALAAEVVAVDSHFDLAELSIGRYRLAVPGRGLVVGDAVRLQVHARDVAIALSPPDALSIRNVLPAQVTAIDDPGAGSYADVSLSVDGTALRARITRASLAALGLATGQQCYALVKSAAVENNPAFIGR